MCSRATRAESTSVGEEAELMDRGGGLGYLARLSGQAGARLGVAARRGDLESEALKGRGSLREELAQGTLRAAREEREHRVAVERHAGSAQADKALLLFFDTLKGAETP